MAFPDTQTWDFLPAIQERAANAAARVALYADADPRQRSAAHRRRRRGLPHLPQAVTWRVKREA
jgi:hypothetical protein